MRRKIIAVVFVAVTAVLAVFVIERTYFSQAEEQATVARVVIPQVQGTGSDGAAFDENYGDAPLVSLIPLAGDETLIDTLDMDFDGDGQLDQVNAVRSVASPYLTLLVGLCDPATGEYARSAAIATPVRQVRTFSYTGMDLTGDHRTALVYQGFLENGNSVLQAFFISRAADGAVQVLPAVNLESNGTIFIQQQERDSAYTLSQANGKSFAIWVYGSDDSRPDSADQIHTRYEWNPARRAYEQAERILVSGNSIAARQLASIQDGTVETFALFLDGMWYKTESQGASVSYLYFDYAARQITFMKDDEQSVYDWQASNVRRNGMYISTTNLAIENLQRRMDVSLRGMDEVSVSVHDEVRLVIAETSAWNGTYKKLSYTALLSGQDEQQEDAGAAIAADLEQGPQWKLPDGTVVSFDGGIYAAWGETDADEGRFTALTHGGSPFVQFRSESATPLFSKMYLASYAPLADNPAEANPDSIILQPYVLMPDREYASADRVMVLTRFDPEVEMRTRAEELALAVPDEPEGAPEEPAGTLAYSSTGNGPSVTVDSSANPYARRYFSPDGDGNEDTLVMRLECTSPQSIRSWSLVVRDSRSNSVFWRTDGTSMPAVSDKAGTYATTVTWDGRGTRGELVTSAEDYPYEFTVTDSAGLTSTYSSIIPVDVLVVREGGRLKMQVPSIVFRGDAADFKLTGELDDTGKVIARSSLSAEQRQNNERVLLRIAQILNKFGTYRVTIVGHANPTNPYDGPEKDNPEENRDGPWGPGLIALSRARAQYVKDWLVTEGKIASSRLSVEGKGGLELAVNQFDMDNRWRNRRVEFILER